MIEKKYLQITVILFLLIFLSLFIPIKSPTGYMAKNLAISTMPTCKGNLDYSKLDNSIFKGCNDYKVEFEKAMQNKGLDNIDLLLVYALSYKESSCRDATELKSAGSLVWGGGILQVDNPCLCSSKKISGYEKCYSQYRGKWQCQNPQSQIDEGLDVFKGLYDQANSNGLSGNDAISLALFGYNRGESAMKKAIDSLDQYDSVMLAMGKTCEEIYNKNGKGCALCRLDSKGNDKCYYPGYGAMYPKSVFDKYDEACRIVGGTLEDLEVPKEDDLTKKEGIFFKKSIISRAIGYFKMNPSFEVKEEFDFTEYDRIVETVKQLSGTCGEVDSKRECVETFLLTPANTAKLKIGPQDKKKAELLNTVEQIDLCSKTLDPNTNCICNITIDKKEELSKVYDDMRIIFFDSTKHIQFKYEEDEFIIDYDDRFDDLYEGEGIDQTEKFKPLMKKLPQDRNYFYMGIKEKTQGKFKLFLSEDNSNNLPVCNLDQKKYVFSIKNDNELMYYDQDKEKYNIGSPDIEFAFYLKEDLLEPGKVYYTIENLDFSEDKLLLKINENQERDIKNYYVFYSSNPFTDKAKDVLSLGRFSEIKYISITNGAKMEAYNDYEYDSSKCGDMIGTTQVSCNLFFKLMDDSGIVEKKIDSGITYYFKNKKQYVRILDLKSKNTDKIYISIIAIDQSGNILDFKEAGVDLIEVKDLLHPSAIFEKEPVLYWDEGTITFDFSDILINNIDGSNINDFKEFWLYQRQNNENNVIVGNDRFYPVNLGNKKIVQRNYNSNPNEKYCYFILATDINLPQSNDYSSILSKDLYYDNLAIDYTCVNLEDLPKYNGVVAPSADDIAIEPEETDIVPEESDIKPEGSDEVYTNEEEVVEQPIGDLCLISTLTNIDNSISCTNNLCKVIDPVNEKLKEVQEKANEKGVKLIITSSYRSYEKQQFLYDCYQTKKSTGNCPSECYESNCNEAAKPSCNSPHLTGGAIDVKLDTANMDHTDHPSVVKGYDERELLEQLMCEEGFVRYEGEFWHYEYGTNRWDRGQESDLCAIV